MMRPIVVAPIATAPRSDPRYLNRGSGAIMSKAKMAVGAALAVGLFHSAGMCHADPADPSYNWQAMCRTWSTGLTGDPGTNLQGMMGVADEIVKLTGVSWAAAWDTEIYQVQTYCPQYWPSLANAMQYAQTHGIYVGPQ
jgi:hypothetical protein